MPQFIYIKLNVLAISPPETRNLSLPQLAGKKMVAVTVDEPSYDTIIYVNEDKIIRHLVRRVPPVFAAIVEVLDCYSLMRPGSSYYLLQPYINRLGITCYSMIYSGTSLDSDVTMIPRGTQISAQSELFAGEVINFDIYTASPSVKDMVSRDIPKTVRKMGFFGPNKIREIDAEMDMLQDKIKTLHIQRRKLMN